MQEKHAPFFHSTLIVGANPRQRKEQALKLATEALGSPVEKLNGIDLFEVGGELKQAGISIEEIRKLQGQLSTKPYQSPQKVALILEAQKMSLAAQNCLLKTLEEPPDHSLLILTGDDTESVLPTVRSRCRILDLGPAPHEGKAEEGRDIIELLQKNHGQRLLWVEENKKMLSGREEVLALLDAWLVTLREELISPKDAPLRRGKTRPPEAGGWGTCLAGRQVGGVPYLQTIQQILTTKKTAATVNVNLRLALEVLLLRLPEPEGLPAGKAGCATALPSG